MREVLVLAPPSALDPGGPEPSDRADGSSIGRGDDDCRAHDGDGGHGRNGGGHALLSAAEAIAAGLPEVVSVGDFVRGQMFPERASGQRIPSGHFRARDRAHTLG